MPRQGLLFKGSGEFLFTLWYSVPDAEIGKRIGVSSYYNCGSARWELNAYNMPRSVCDPALLSCCSGWSRQCCFAKQKNLILKLNIKVSEAGLEGYLPQKHAQTPSEIQLTMFQQRQGILPDSSISSNCHVFMYLSLTTDSDIK